MLCSDAPCALRTERGSQHQPREASGAGAQAATGSAAASPRSRLASDLRQPAGGDRNPGRLPRARPDMPSPLRAPRLRPQAGDRLPKRHPHRPGRPADRRDRRALVVRALGRLQVSGGRSQLPERLPLVWFAFQPDHLVVLVCDVCGKRISLDPAQAVVRLKRSGLGDGGTGLLQLPAVARRACSGCGKRRFSADWSAPPAPGTPAYAALKR